MGKRGPAPKAHKLRVIEGTAGRRPPDAPALGRAGSPPAHLAPEAKAVWLHVVDSMPAGFYSAADRQALERYSAACARWRQAEAEIAAGGCIGVGSMGQPVPSPWLRIGQDAGAICARLESALGLTPAARVGLTSAPPEGGDEFDALTGAGSYAGMPGA